MRRLLFIALSVLCVCTLGVFHVKYQVAILKQGVEGTTRERDVLEAELALLKIELTHLSSPGRLDQLNQKFIRLVPPEGAQMRTLEQMPTSSSRREV